MTMTSGLHPAETDGPGTPSAGSIVRRAVGGVLVASLVVYALQRMVDASGMRGTIGVTLVALGSAGALVATCSFALQWRPSVDATRRKLAIAAGVGLALGLIASSLPVAPAWWTANDVALRPAVVDVATAALLGFDIAVVEECLSRLLLQRCLVAVSGVCAGSALQVMATVLMHVPWTSAMPGWRTAQLLSFSLAATALATSRFGLASAIAFHAAFDGALLVVYGSGPLADPPDDVVIAPLLAVPAGPWAWALTSLACSVVAAWMFLRFRRGPRTGHDTPKAPRKYR